MNLNDDYYKSNQEIQTYLPLTIPMKRTMVVVMKITRIKTMITPNQDTAVIMLLEEFTTHDTVRERQYKTQSMTASQDTSNDCI